MCQVCYIKVFIYSTVDNTNGLLIACQACNVLIVVYNGCEGEQVSRGERLACIDLVHKEVL
jgi:hypothetical protein